MAFSAETFPTLQSQLLRRWRLASGQVLWCYIALHFVNHALGGVSLDAAEAALKFAAFVWQSLPGTVLLYGAAATYEWFGDAPHYRRIVTNLIRSGNTGWQLAMLAPGWAHGCMGLNVAFRHRAWFQRWRPALLAAAVSLPLLAAGGFWVMTRELADAVNASANMATAPRALLDVIHQQQLGNLRERLLNGYIALVGAVLVSRTGFAWRRERRARAGGKVTRPGHGPTP